MYLCNSSKEEPRHLCREMPRHGEAGRYRPVFSAAQRSFWIGGQSLDTEIHLINGPETIVSGCLLKRRKCSAFYASVSVGNMRFLIFFRFGFIPDDIVVRCIADKNGGDISAMSGKTRRNEVCWWILIWLPCIGRVNIDAELLIFFPLEAAALLFRFKGRWLPCQAAKGKRSAVIYSGMISRMLSAE